MKSATENGNKKPIYRKAWFWIVVVVVLFIGAAGANDEKTDNTATDSSNSGASQQEAVSEAEEKPKRKVAGETTTLGTGTFFGGSDLSVGLYDVTASAGQSGNFITSGGTNEILGGEYGVTKIRVKVEDGEEIKISGLSSVTFTPVKKPFVFEHKDISLYSGTFIVNEDIGEGRYKVTTDAGQSGNFITSGGTNEILGGEYGVPNATVNLNDGEEVILSGMNTVRFSAL